MYILSETLRAFITLSTARMRRGLGATLLLEGPPGGGKTAFARELATQLGATLYRYDGAPDKERNLLYDIDVDGVVRREGAWIKGPAWEAFEATQSGYAVLLLDEVDKTSPGFDAFLLRILEEGTFRAPGGEEIAADLSKLVVIMTSNGKRDLRPEVLRRCQRVRLEFPSGHLLHDIMDSIAKEELPQGLRDLVVRIGDYVRHDAPEQAPSPKEMALCILDLLHLQQTGTTDAAIWRKVAASYLTKQVGKPEAIDIAVAANTQSNRTWNWAKALRTEAVKAVVLVT